MKVVLTLDVEHKDSENFYKSILPDFEKKGRSEVEMNLDKNRLVFKIESKDFTSVRATINGILLKLRTLNELYEMEWWIWL